jgi:hypothetical protein
VAKAMTYQPRTQTGAKLSQLIGQARRTAVWVAWRCPN